MFNVTSLDTLIECLGAIPPVHLQGIQLLQTLRAETGQWFPIIDPEQITTATIELLDYSLQCQKVADALKDLTPVCITQIPIEEYCL